MVMMVHASLTYNETTYNNRICTVNIDLLSGFFCWFIRQLMTLSFRAFNSKMAGCFGFLLCLWLKFP